MEGHYRPFNDEDITSVASNMCEADILELQLSDGLSPFDALSRACKESTEAYTIVGSDGELLGMFGLSYVDDLVGSPWMLSTGKLSNYYVKFLRQSRQWVEDANNRRGVLVNYVHAENDNAIKWLRFLGFSFIRKVGYGASNAPFYEFVRIK